jgi:chorismate mutase
MNFATQHQNRPAPYRASYHGLGTIRVCRLRRRPHFQHSEARSMDIADWRKKIDELDEQIVTLISRRAEAAKAIGELKQRANMPVYEPGRERDVFEHIRAANPGPLPDAEILHVYERIIDVMRTLQRPDSA